jgi:hypothetical protein
LVPVIFSENKPEGFIESLEIAAVANPPWMPCADGTDFGVQTCELLLVNHEKRRQPETDQHHPGNDRGEQCYLEAERWRFHASGFMR